jgi:hypothetical protein
MGRGRQRKVGAKRRVKAKRARAVSKGPHRVSDRALAERLQAALTEADFLQTAASEMAMAARAWLSVYVACLQLFKEENQKAQERFARISNRSHRPKNSK